MSSRATFDHREQTLERPSRSRSKHTSLHCGKILTSRNVCQKDCMFSLERRRLERERERLPRCARASADGKRCVRTCRTSSGLPPQELGRFKSPIFELVCGEFQRTNRATCLVANLHTTLSIYIYIGNSREREREREWPRLRSRNHSDQNFSTFEFLRPLVKDAACSSVRVSGATKSLPGSTADMRSARAAGELKAEPDWEDASASSSASGKSASDASRRDPPVQDSVEWRAKVSFQHNIRESSRYIKSSIDSRTGNHVATPQHTFRESPKLSHTSLSQPFSNSNGILHTQNGRDAEHARTPARYARTIAPSPRSEALRSKRHRVYLEFDFPWKWAKRATHTGLVSERSPSVFQLFSKYFQKTGRVFLKTETPFAQRRVSSERERGGTGVVRALRHGALAAEVGEGRQRVQLSLFPRRLVARCVATVAR